MGVGLRNPILKSAIPPHKSRCALIFARGSSDKIFFWICGDNTGIAAAFDFKRGASARIPQDVFRVVAGGPLTVCACHVLARNQQAQMPQRVSREARGSGTLQTLAEDYGVEMISPNRSNRKQRTQDGRPLRRYRRRWKIERVFAWMQNYRRLVPQWEYRIENFLGFVQLACLMMLLRHL